MPNTKHSRARWELIILASMYVGYMAFILCRTAIQVNGPAMIGDSRLQISKTLFGQILAWGTAGMVVGKLTTGIIADTFGGRRTFLLALLLVAVMAIVMGSASSFPAFASANFVMLFAAAAGWPAMANLILSWYSPQKYGKVWGAISTSSRMSSMLSMLLLGLLLSLVSWPHIFRAAGILSIVVLSIISFSLKAHPTDIGLTEHVDKSIELSPITHPLDSKGPADALMAFLKSSRFWLICFSLMATTVLMEFIGFIPIYLKESFHIEPSLAAKATAVFPAGCLIALIGGGYLYDQVTRRGRMLLLGGMLVMSCLCIVLLWNLPSLPIPESLRFGGAVGSLLFYGLTVAPAYYLPMSIFSNEFGGKHCGLLIGLIDATGYAASMLYQYSGGIMVDRWGWSSMLTLLFSVSLIAIIVTVWFSYCDYRVMAVELAKN